MSVCTRTLTSQKVLDFLRPKKPNLFKNNLHNNRNKVKSRIHKKKNGGIGGLLVTLNKIIRNQGTYFVVIMSNGQLWGGSSK